MIPDVRIYVRPRTPAEMNLGLLDKETKTFYAFACVGLGKKMHFAASGYGLTETDALDDLEANVSATPVPHPIRPTSSINHRASAREPNAPFTSLCAAPGCDRQVVRVFGAAARLGNFRHIRQAAKR